MRLRTRPPLLTYLLRPANTMVRHAHRRPYSQTQHNTATVPLCNQPTNINQLH